MNQEKTAQLISIIRNAQALFSWKALLKPQQITTKDQVQALCEDTIRAFVWLTKLMGEGESKPSYGKRSLYPETFRPFLENVIRNNPTNQEPFERYEVESIFAELSETITDEAAPVTKRMRAKRFAEQLRNVIEGHEPNDLKTIRVDANNDGLTDALEELAEKRTIQDDENEGTQQMVCDYLLNLNNEIVYLQKYWDIYLADIMQQDEASTIAPVSTSGTQEATQSVSEGVSADDGITIKAEEIKPSEGLKKLFYPKYVDYADKLLAKDITSTSSKDRIIHLADTINDWSRNGICTEIYNHAPEWAKALKESMKIDRAERTILDDLRKFMQ